MTTSNIKELRAEMNRLQREYVPSPKDSLKQARARSANLVEAFADKGLNEKIDSEPLKSFLAAHDGALLAPAGAKWSHAEIDRFERETRVKLPERLRQCFEDGGLLTYRLLEPRVVRMYATVEEMLREWNRVNDCFAAQTANADTEAEAEAEDEDDGESLLGSDAVLKAIERGDVDLLPFAVTEETVVFALALSVRGENDEHPVVAVFPNDRGASRFWPSFGAWQQEIIRLSHLELSY